MLRFVAALSALALAAPAMADEVNVYSYRQPDLIKPLTDAFTAKTGIKVNSVFLKKGLVERLKAEGDRSPADLIFTVDIGRLAGAVNAGVTQAVDSAALNDSIPAAFRDPEGQWFGVTSRARLIYASKERVAPGEVTTYEDLADPKWKGRICMRSGLNAYSLALIAAVIAHHGEDAAETWLRGLKANLARKPQGNDRAQVKAIWAGECDISIGNNYYMAAMLKNDEQKEWANSVNVVFPTFADGGTHMNISGMAMTKAAPNRENALKLMAFLASEEGQTLYSQINSEYPVDPAIAPSDLVASWGDFERDDKPLREIADLRPTALKLVETVDFDG